MPPRLDLRAREPSALSRAATAACGLLLGCVILLLEIVQQPISRVSWAQIEAFAQRETPLWLGCGLGWAFVARFAEPRVGIAGLIAVGAATTACLSAALVLCDAPRPIASSRVVALGDFAAHVAWTNAFCGGLYLAVYAGWRRSARSARFSARMRLARDESLALLQLSRVESFRRALQPETILQSIDALRRLYDRDPVEADALLDIVVGFLRSAVRSLNAEACAFPEELDLAWRYLQLRQRTVGGVGVLSVPGSPPAPAIPFPPRLLMPILEAACLGGGQVDLSAGWRNGAYSVDLVAAGAAADAFAPPLRRRMSLLGEQPGVFSRLSETARHLRWSLLIDPSAMAPSASASSVPSGVNS